jgi:hypothetical protein
MHRVLQKCILMDSNQSNKLLFDSSSLATGGNPFLAVYLIVWLSILLLVSPIVRALLAIGSFSASPCLPATLSLG